VDLGFRLGAAGHEIINDPGMASIHLGQADSIASFLRKEMWRGRSLISSLRAQGVAAAPSRFSLAVLIYALALVYVPVALVLAGIKAASIGGLVVVAAPAALAMRSAFRRGTARKIPAMCALWFLFLLARSASLVRYRQISLWQRNSHR
jgi:hypothetical protein